MRVGVTIVCLLILTVLLLASTPAQAQLGSSQGGAAMTPLTPMTAPPTSAPMPIGGATNSGQLWPWYGGGGAFGYSTPQSEGTGGPKPFGTAASSQPFGQAQSAPPAGLSSSMGNMYPGAGANQTTAAMPPQPMATPSARQEAVSGTSVPGFSGIAERLSPAAAGPVIMPTPNFPTLAPQAFNAPQYQSTPSYSGPSSPTVSTEKPFSGYRSAPAISPYMGLYQFNTDPGVNNYYAYVRPALDQLQVNRQLEWQNQALQSSLLNSSGSPNTPVGSPTGAPIQSSSIGGSGAPPSFYMNFRNYYPGFAPGR
jgi:hypothetical protein